MTDKLTKAYNAEQFRNQGHQLVDFLADYLAAMQKDSSDQFKAIQFTDPKTSLKNWEAHASEPFNGEWIDLFKSFFQHSVLLHHPHYMGHQISPPLPATALAGFLSDFLNNGMGVYEMGVVSSTLEKVVTNEVARVIGYDEKAGGILTSGGTLGNLTALLCARSVKASEAVWSKGNKKQLALMVSDQAHYCVDKAVRIMGWGEAGIILVPTNEKFQMRTELLDTYYQQAIQEDKEVIAVVGSACSTSTGSFDDLNVIADFCEQRNLWFHIDGAHGGGIVFSEKYRSILSGIERADSSILDFHKMLITPAITTALTFKEEKNSFRTFALKAEYLWNEDGDPEWFNYAKRTFECTKLMMSIKIYSTLKLHGTTVWDQYVTTVMDLGQLFGEMIKTHESFELVTMPECNIVCFRWNPKKLEDDALVNTINDAIRQQLLEEGKFYIVKTMLHGRLWLRTTLTNPFTTAKHLNDLLVNIQTIGEQQLSARTQLTP